MPNAEKALAGVWDIVAEVVSDDAEVRKIVRNIGNKKGLLVSTARDPEDVGEF